MTNKLKIVSTVARFLLGLILFVFGLNGFLMFLPLPPLPQGAMDFVMALVNSGYEMTLVKGMEVVCGLMILSGFCVPFALVLIAPIVFNIFFFHAFLAPQGMLVPTVMLILWSFLVWAHRKHYQGVFAVKSQIAF